MNLDQARDDHGRFAGGLGAWAAKKAPTSPGKLVAEAMVGKRVWTDQRPAGLKPESWQGHFDKDPAKGGKPNAERQKLYDGIVHDATKGVSKPDKDEQKVAIFTMGAPASGKSSMLREVDPARFVRVDPDAIMEKIPEYKQAIDPHATFRGAAAMAHEEAVYVAHRVLDAAIEQGKHVVVDGTGANLNAIGKKIDRMKDAGYHVHVAYAHLASVIEGMKRNVQRAEVGGRFVPPAYVKAAYHDIPRNFERIARKADTFAVHDSSRTGSPVVWDKTPDGEHQRDPAFVASFRARYKS